MAGDKAYGPLWARPSVFGTTRSAVVPRLENEQDERVGGMDRQASVSRLEAIGSLARPVG